MTTGFIGLGNMGRPMASNLAKKGHALVVHDVNRDAVHALTAVGARGAGSVAELVPGCDVIFTMLPDSAIVEAVIAGAGGVFANATAGATVVDMSTIDPLVT